MNSYLIDGIYNRNLWLSTLIMVPTVDSIQEFRVMTSNFSAEFGSAAGAVTVVHTKSGANELHGGVYEFLRNDDFDANNFFNNRAGLPKPAFVRNEFGGTIGGPVVKDKVFFFGDYQGLRVRQPRSFTATLPSLAQRHMIQTGDFGELGSALFDPLDVADDQRAPFPNNSIPATRLDQPAVTLAGMLPNPNVGANQFRSSPSFVQDTDQFDVRTDVNIGSADRLFLKYGFDNTNVRDPGSMPAPANSPVDVGLWLSSQRRTGNSGTNVPLRNQSFTVGYTKPFSSELIGEFHFGAVRWNQEIGIQAQAINSADQLGVPGVNLSDKSGGLPVFGISGGFSSIGHSNSFPEDSKTTTYQGSGAFTAIRGNHTVKFGVHYFQHYFDGFSSFPVRGEFDFNGQFTRQRGSGGSRTALADFALGAHRRLRRSILTGDGFRMRFWQANWFVEDSWRVTNKLTLNLGIRQELQAPPYDADDEWAALDINTGIEACRCWRE